MRLRRLAHVYFGWESDDVWVNSNANKLKITPKDPNGLLNQLYRQYGLSAEEIMNADFYGQPVMLEWSRLSSRQAKGQQAGYLHRLISVLPDTGILNAKPDAGMQHTISDMLLSEDTLHLLDPTTPAPPNENDEPPQMTATVTDICVLNLVNSLVLTAEQMKSLLAIDAKAKDEYQAIELQRRALAAQCLLPQHQLRDSYLAGKGANAAAVTQLVNLNSRWQTLWQQETALDEHYSAQVRGVLTEQQLTAVAKYIPSMLPARSPAKPERRGEASNSSTLEQALTTMRTLPQNQLSQQEELLQLEVAEAFRKKNYREAQIQAITTLVPVVVNQARAMDDATFTAKKTELAQMLSAPDKQPGNNNNDASDERLVTYLCSANLIPIFTARTSGGR